MSKENFYIDITGNVNQLYYIDEYKYCRWAFTGTLFKKFGINARLVNNICRELDIKIDMGSIKLCRTHNRKKKMKLSKPNISFG